MLANRKAKLDWATECQTPLDETRISMFKMNNSTNSNINANTSSNPNTSPSSSFPSSSASASASTSASASSSSSSLSTTTASNNTAIAPSSSSVSTDPATATATTTLNKDSSEKDQHPLLFHPQPPHLHQQRQQQQQQQQLRGQPHNMYYPTSADPAIASMGVGVGSVGMGALHPNTNPSLTSNPNLQSSHSSAQQQHLQQQQQQQSLQQQSQQQQQQQQSFIQNSPLPPGAPLPYPHHFFNNMNMGINPDVYAATVAMQQQLGLVGVGGAGVNLLSTSPHTHGHGHSHGHGHIHNMAGTAATSPAGQHQPNSGFPNPALASMTLGMQGMGINGLPTIAGLTGGLNGMGSLNVNALGVGANPNLVPSLAALGLSPSPHPTGHPINLNHLNVNHSGHPHLHHNPHGIAPPPPPISPSSVGGPPSATSTGPGMGMPGGPSANNRKLGLYKTELCRSWEEKGSCRYGPKCQFAHGEDELRKVSRHPKYKTEICRTFWVSGSCPYGKRCCFIHTELPPSPADGVPPPSSGPSTANPTPVTNSSGPTSPVRNKSMGELNDTHPNGVSEQQQQQLSLLTRLNNNVNNGIPTSASAPVTASSTPASASPAPGQNTNVAIPSSQLATPTTEGSVTPTSAYPKNNDFSSDSEVSSHLASSGAGTTPTGRASRPTFLRVDTHINTSVSMKQNKSAFPIMNPNTLTSLALGGMSMGGGGSGISGAGNNSSSNNSGGSRLSFGRLSSGAVNTIGTNGAGAGGGASGNNAGSGMAQSQIGYGGVLLSPAPVTAGPDLGGTARRFENFDRFPKASTPVTATPPRPSTSDSNKDISPPTTSAGGASSGSSGSGSANVRHSFTGENMGLQSHFANLTLNTNVNGNGSPNSIPYHGGQMKHTPPPLTAGPVPSTSSAVAQAILHGRSGSDGSSGANLGSLSGMGGVGLGGLSLSMNMINGTPAANAGATGGNAGINGNSGSSAWGNSNKFLSRGALSALPGGPSVVPPWATGNSGSNSGNGGSK